MLGFTTKRGKREEIRDILINKLKHRHYNDRQRRVLENIKDLADADAVDATLKQCRAMAAHVINGGPLPPLMRVPAKPRQAVAESGDDPLVALYLLSRLLGK